MADVVRAVGRYRDRLASHREVVTRDLIRIYGASLDRLDKDLRRVQREIAARRRAGLPVSKAWLARERRYRELSLNIAKELLDNARYTLDLLDDVEERIVARALESASDIVTDLTETPAVLLDRLTVRQVIAATSDRAPLRELLEKRAGAKAEDVREALVTSILRGDSPAQTARRMQNAYGGALANALTIATTEMARAQREASRLTWLRDPKVTGWWWKCRCTTRSCAFCWAQHGTTHSLSEVMGTHPNCLCLMLPIAAGVDYGDTGVGLFDDLSRPRKLKVLGPAKLAAYEAGEITLADLVGTKRHPRWGPSGFERSLVDVLGPARAAAFYAPTGFVHI